jgi:butyrate kinase
VDSLQIFVINPGSTSTKISLFQGEDEVVSETLRHNVEELAQYAKIIDQAGFRRGAIDAFLSLNNVDIPSLDAVIGRGGLLHPLESGVYRVNEGMVSDLAAGRYGEHASNLGAILAQAIAGAAGCDAYIADPVVVDEMEECARLSGVPELPRRSIFHALNQKSAAREAAARLGRAYEEINAIVAHMGGGCSVGAHRRGRVVDVNNALDGEGPFSPERAGTVPAGQLVSMTLSGEFTHAELKKKLTGRGGLVAYCGTNNLEELIARIDGGDHAAKVAFESMAYQISKEIASHGATLAGSVDVIVLTGGMAYNERLGEEIHRRVSYLAPVEVIPGEREMLSLARAAGLAVRGDVHVKQYTQESDG